MTDGETTQQQENAATAALPPDSTGNKPPEEMSVGELVFEVSDRASVLSARGRFEASKGL